MISTFKKMWNNCEDRHSSLVTALIFSLLKSAFSITQLFAIVATINVLLNKEPFMDGLITIIICTVICIIGNYITSYFEQINTMKTGYFMVADKRVSIGNKLKRLPLGFFNNSSRTRTISTLTTTLSGLETASVMVMVGIITGLLNTLAIFIFMLVYEYEIGLIAGFGMVVYILVVSYQMKLSRKNAPKVTKAQEELSENTLSFLQGIKVIKSFSFTEGDTKLKDAIDNSSKANIKLTKQSMPSFYMASLVIAVFESLLLLTTLLLHFSVGSIDITKTIILMIFSFMVYAALNQAGSMLAMIGLLDSGLDELKDIENNKELEIEEPKGEPESNEISFDNVSFSYGDNEVIHNISFTVKAKSFTALVGPSGSGKTTICELIPRFYDINKGEIKIGGVNVKNIEYETICKNISMVFQRVYLFEDTIFNNVRFGNPDATLEEVRDACKKAMCDDFIMQLPDGYDTVLTEGGNNLSGGEKQRLSIARAIIKDAPIILLDEATASVDPENEYEICKAIDNLTKDKTIVMIAHKLNTIKNADQIIVLQDGKIVSKGTHNELKNKGGLYKDFLETRIEASNFKIRN